MSVDRIGLCGRFLESFGGPPRWGARAPGRVNLIGEHIDYNGGYVLPAAIDRDVAIVAAPSPDSHFHLRSALFTENFKWPALSPPNGPVPEGWPNFFIAVVDELNRRGLDPPALSVLIDGDIPVGAGLSSSAAFEVCATVLLLSALGNKLPGAEVAKLAQAAENSPRVGLSCGIMDPFVSVHAVEDCALKLNCSTLEFQPVRIDPAKVRILIVHSTVQRELVRSAYNERRAECEKGLEELNRATGRDNTYLVSYNQQDVHEYGGRLPRSIRKRIHHVVAEQARVLACIEALEGGDFTSAGALMNESHASLRDEYEVSCPELDAICEIAWRLEGVYGCRMTGGGFGGCAVALVSPEKVDAVSQQIRDRFNAQFGKTPWALESPASAGALRFDPLADE